MKTLIFALSDHEYDLSSFLSEQASQLYLKSVLLELVGDSPRTHSLRILLDEVPKSKPSKELDFVRMNRAEISSLEDAEDLLKVAEEIVKRVGMRP